MTENRLASYDYVHLVSNRGTAAAHRAAVTAADVITSPTCVDKLAAGAADITLATTNVFAGVAAGTAYGTNACGALSAAFTPTENKSLLLTIAQVDGAEYYDCFCSVDAAPKWVCRVTEAQRAAGAVCTAVGTVTTTGGTAGKVDLRVLGTGAVTTAARFASTVATIAVGKSTIETINCTSFKRAYVRARLSGGALAAVPTATLTPFTLDADGVSWIPGTPATVTVGRGAEQFAVDVDGDSALRIGVSAILAGATANISVVLV